MAGPLHGLRVIELADDEKTHNVRIVMGEQVKTEETEAAQQAQA